MATENFSRLQLSFANPRPDGHVILVQLSCRFRDCVRYLFLFLLHIRFLWNLYRHLVQSITIINVPGDFKGERGALRFASRLRFATPS